MITENAIEHDRNATIKAIKTALKRRSGKAWSVTGGRGTAYGWIRIDAPPARKIKHYRLKFDMPDIPENYESYLDPANPNGYMTDSDQAELAHLLGLEKVHNQGESIPAASDYRREYIDRAQGRTPSVIGQQYWD